MRKKTNIFGYILLVSITFFITLNAFAKTISDERSTSTRRKPCCGAKEPFIVLGYLRPNEFEDIDKMDLSKTNYINLSFANINEDGRLMFKKDFKPLVKKLRSKDIRVMMAIGGGKVHGKTADYWRKHLSDPYRSKLVANMVQYVEKHKLDGIDVDFENQFLTSLGENFNLFVLDLQKSLHAKNKQITAAFPCRRINANVSKEAIGAFDFINIMSYGTKGPWRPDNPGQHSPMSLVKTVNDFWVKEQGVPHDKIVFGLPFYGFDFDQMKGNKKGGVIWSKIIKKNPEYAYIDQVGQLWYNGIPTIAKKTHEALKLFGGVMVWSYGTDVYNDMSLLKTINQVIEAGLRENQDIQTFYQDGDGDGYGDLNKPFQAYNTPKGYVANRLDTNDRDATIHP
ncbi:hypothetical protein K5X82_06095 [Halosquirtibacter xylanolyticus]|uniref:glycosyl hydrolase family 18 protein n=1 Tax=Halosquirtibacter xylanolyticus TaxID=3374599 RepID=UPI003748A624|nr:hypothetical protein K5X82_06095 [Prolixibacteraceae bacterium]